MKESQVFQYISVNIQYKIKFVTNTLSADNMAVC